MSGFDLLCSYGVSAAAHCFDFIKALDCGHPITNDDVVDGVEQDIGLVFRQAIHNVLSLLFLAGLPCRLQSYSVLRVTKPFWVTTTNA